MSLVFLKSKNRETTAGLHNPHRPSRFSNFFTTPLHLEPNSQVALYNTQFFAQEGDELEGENILEMRNGNQYMNPILAYPINDKYITNWKEEMNDIARYYNICSADGNFNHILERTQIPAAIGTTTFQSQQVFESGLNLWYSDDENKVFGRLTQRPCNEVFNQSFNCLGTNDLVVYSQPNGFGACPPQINIGSGDNLTQFTPDQNFVGFFNVNYSNAAPTLLSNVGIALTPAMLGGGNINTASSFYNTQWANCKLQLSSIDYNRSLSDVASPFGNTNGVDNSEIAFDNDNGSYALIAAAAPIKQFVGQSVPAVTPELNGGGHAFPSTAISGGYALLTRDMVSKATADIYTPALEVGGSNIGRVGLTASCFGVHSYEFVNKYFDSDPEVSRRLFLENCDLTIGESPTSPEGAAARYLLGVRYEWRGAAPARKIYAVCEILKPDTSLFASEYEKVAELDLYDLCAGVNRASDPDTNFGGTYDINITGGPNTKTRLIWRFRWISPYQMNVEFCFEIDGNPAGAYRITSDEPYVLGASNDPTQDWCLLYTMDFGADGTTGDSFYFPNFHGGMMVVDYPTRQNQNTYTKGWYDMRVPYMLSQGKAEGRIGRAGDAVDAEGMNEWSDLTFWSGQDFGNNVNMTMVKNIADPLATPKIVNLTPEKFASTGESKKDFTMLVGPLKFAETSEWENFGDLENSQPRYKAEEPTNNLIGYDLGLIKANGNGLLKFNKDIDGTGVEYILQGFNPQNAIRIAGSGATLHFQITNLPIKSQQGVVASVNKTFAIVNTLCENSHQNTKDNGAGWYCVEPHEKTWIDLNNYGPIDLNRLEILITDDDNKEASDLLAYTTDLTICFRQKPNNKGFKEFQGQTQPAVLDPNNPYYQNVRN